MQIDRMVRGWDRDGLTRIEVGRLGLDRLWAKYRDGKGVSTPEARADYKRFNDPVYVPAGWTGKMPNGDVIDASSTFLSIRSKYKQDPDWPKMRAFLSGGAPPKMAYHRFWAQADIAIANAAYGMLFPQDKGAGLSGKPDHHKGGAAKTAGAAPDVNPDNPSEPKKTRGKKKGGQ